MVKLFKKNTKRISFDEAALNLDDALNPGEVTGACLRYSLRAQLGREPGHNGRHQEVQSVVEGPFEF